MNLINEIYRLESLEQMIRLQSTGSLNELAKKMNVSRRTAMRWVGILKELGCPIYFDKHKNSYCYEYPGKLVIGWKMKTIENK
jgi:predicted DNA-binding transcriptional regulator YafY